MTDDHDRIRAKAAFYNVLKQRYPLPECEPMLLPLIEQKEFDVFKARHVFPDTYDRAMAEVIWKHSMWIEIVSFSTLSSEIADRLLAWWLDVLANDDRQDVIIGYIETFTYFCINKFDSIILSRLNDVFGQHPVWLYFTGMYIYNHNEPDNATDFFKRSMKLGHVPALTFLLAYYEKTMKWSSYASLLFEAPTRDPNNKNTHMTNLSRCYFYGLGVVQSYERGNLFFKCKNFGGDTHNQLHVVIRMLVDQGCLYIQTALQLRLVCKKWNQIIMSCGKFWKRFKTSEPIDSVPLCDVSQYALEHAATRLCASLDRSCVCALADCESVSKKIRYHEDEIDRLKRLSQTVRAEYTTLLNRKTVHEGYKKRRI